MGERFDAVAARKWTDREGNEQTSFTNIGVAFPFKEKEGYSLKLHCLPAPVDGEYTVLLFPPKPREDRAQEPRQESSGGYGAGKRRITAPAFESGGGDDDIPFAPEWRG